MIKLYILNPCSPYLAGFVNRKVFMVTGKVDILKVRSV